MKDIDPRFDARFDTIVYPAARKARPFWPVVVLVVVACFFVTLYWPNGEADKAPAPVVEAPVAQAPKTKRDVISIADPDLAQRRAERDREVAEQWGAASFDDDVHVAPRRATGGRRIFAGCNEARAAGRENIPSSDPAYHEDMDGDGDGLACEPIR